mmetsp:Transcript_64346/g.176616  ORF Transcript_64346/g.176616 Transcript_64346/m.176616 type:complete len:210 (+) Transcript_64346:429-1058(+)
MLPNAASAGRTPRALRSSDGLGACLPARQLMKCSIPRSLCANFMSLYASTPLCGATESPRRDCTGSPSTSMLNAASATSRKSSSSIAASTVSRIASAPASLSSAADNSTSCASTQSAGSSRALGMAPASCAARTAAMPSGKLDTATHTSWPASAACVAPSSSCTVARSTDARPRIRFPSFFRCFRALGARSTATAARETWHWMPVGSVT